MRIAFVHNSGMTVWPMRGDLIRMLVARGHQLSVCVPEFHSSCKKKAEEFGVHFEAMPLSASGLNPFADWKYYQSLKTYFEKFQPDIVFSTTIKPVVFASLAASRLKTPPKIVSMINGLGYAFSPKTLRDFILSRLIRLLYRHALYKNNLVIFLNSDDRQLFEELGLLKESHHIVGVNGSGINLQTFQFQRNESDEFRFLFVGRLIRDKGIGEYIEAAKILKSEMPHLQFDVVGYLDPHPSGLSLREMEIWLKEGFINYFGPQEDVRPFLKNSKVFVLPSYREGVSRATLEAMATGRAVITTDAPGCRQTVEENRNGILVTPKSVQSLAEAMRLLAHSPEKATQMGIQSRKIAEEKFDMKKINSQIIEALQA